LLRTAPVVDQFQAPILLCGSPLGLRT